MSNEYKIDINRPQEYGWTFGGSTSWHELPPYHVEEVLGSNGCEWDVKVYQADAGRIRWQEHEDGEFNDGVNEVTVIVGKWSAHDPSDTWVGESESLREMAMWCALRFHVVCSPSWLWQRWPKNAPETGGPIREQPEIARPDQG